MKSIITARKEDIPLYIRRGIAASIAIGMVLIMDFGFHPLFAASVERAYAPLDDAQESREILWLARAVYSETKREDEQVLIAWVIRNRVESESFPDSYEGVVLDPGQFSGLQHTDKNYVLNISRMYEDTGTGWDTALRVARDVFYADGILRPIGRNVTHFYSPNAVSFVPKWAEGSEPERIVRDREKNYIRFAFHADIK